LQETKKDQIYSGNTPKEAIDLLSRVRLFKKMDIYQRQMFLNGTKSSSEKEMLRNLFTTPGELQRVEDQLVEMIS
jgi:hypothetical protein